jgi:hypothetical protein
MNPVRIPPLAKDGQVILKWLKHFNTTLCTSYCDFDGISRVLSGNQLGTWPESEIHHHWDNPPYVESGAVSSLIQNCSFDHFDECRHVCPKSGQHVG